MFCCLLLSAIKLQASTHCLISGAAWAKLLYRLAVLVTSILSTRGKEAEREKCVTEASDTELGWLSLFKKKKEKKKTHQSIGLDRASLSVCQTSFHCEAVSGHIPLLSASAQRSCGAAPLCHSPPLWPHPHPPVGACTASEVPVPGTPAESIVFPKTILINTHTSQSINTNRIFRGAGQDHCWIYLRVWWFGTWCEYWDCARRSWAPRFDWWLWEWWHTWQRSGTWGGWEKTRINQQPQIKDRSNPADIHRSLTCRWEEQKAMSQGAFEQLGKGRQSEPARPRWTQSTSVPRLERGQQRLRGQDSERCLSPHLLESLNS